MGDDAQGVNVWAEQYVDGIGNGARRDKRLDGGIWRDSLVYKDGGGAEECETLADGRAFEVERVYKPEYLGAVDKRGKHVRCRDPHGLDGSWGRVLGEGERYDTGVPLTGRILVCNEEHTVSLDNARGETRFSGHLETLDGAALAERHEPRGVYGVRSNACALRDREQPDTIRIDAGGDCLAWDVECELLGRLCKLCDDVDGVVCGHEEQGVGRSVYGGVCDGVVDVVKRVAPRAFGKRVNIETVEGV
jgi:hypothetical protein